MLLLSLFKSSGIEASRVGSFERLFEGSSLPLSVLPLSP